MARVFYPVDSYAAPEPGYRLLPFRFLRLDQEREVLVNEVGEFVIVPVGTGQSLIRKQLARGSGLYSTFKAKHFLDDHSSTPLKNRLKPKKRSKDSLMYGI